MLNNSINQKNKSHKDVLIYGTFFFFYFFTMATCFPFLSVWLSNDVGLNKVETGIVFSSMSLFAIMFQPIFGIISDQLGLRKHMLRFITILLILIAPFFLYVFSPLLIANIWLGAISGGIYMGCAFSAGVGVVESYIERISRNNDFEYGKARMFGCLGWGLCTTIAGLLFDINPSLVFWMGSACSIMMLLLLLIINPKSTQAYDPHQHGKNHYTGITFKMLIELFSMRKMWMFILYVIGTASIYDVYGQQFAIFFKSFFPSEGEGLRVLGFSMTMLEILNAIIMFYAPWIINRYGAKNMLLFAACIMVIRIIGSAYATTIIEVVILKMLHALEVPFLLVAAFKYITGVFNPLLSATIYLIGFQFSKQLAAIPLSTFSGYLYDKIGFQPTYLVLGCITLAITIISAFTLTEVRKKTTQIMQHR